MVLLIIKQSQKFYLKSSGPDLKKTPSVQSCLDGHFDDLVELFIPFCENTRLDELNKRINQTIQEDFYFDFPLRCEGHVEQEFEVVFYIQQTDVDPVDKIKKDIQS